MHEIRAWDLVSALDKFYFTYTNIFSDPYDEGLAWDSPLYKFKFLGGGGRITPTTTKRNSVDEIGIPFKMLKNNCSL